MPYRTAELSADYSQIGRALGWQPRTGLREGLGRTIARSHEHRDRYRDDDPPRAVRA